MNEPTNENVPVEPTGQVTEPVTPTVEPSGDPDWDAAAAEAAPVAERTPEPVVEPTPTAAEPAPTQTEPEDYTFTTLQNGERELRLATGQVYKGKDDAEILSQVAKAQLHASRTIQELRTTKPSQQAQAPTAPVAPAVPAQIDETALALADLMAPAFGVKSGKELIDRFNGLDQRTQTYAELAAEQQQTAAAMQFVQTTPDFAPSETNAAKIDEVMQELQLPYTVQNYKLAHDVVKGRGLYEAAKPTPVPSQTRPMPLPPSGNAPSPSTGKAEPTLADLEKMSMEDLEKLLDSQAA